MFKTPRARTPRATNDRDERDGERRGSKEKEDRGRIEGEREREIDVSRRHVRTARLKDSALLTPFDDRELPRSAEGSEGARPRGDDPEILPAACSTDIPVRIGEKRRVTEWLNSVFVRDYRSKLNF